MANELSMKRQVFVTVHRYVGLSIAIFMILSGLTGSILAFDPEIDAAVNPELFRIEDSVGASLGPSAIAARVEASDSRLWVRYIPLIDHPRKAIVVYVEPRRDEAAGEHFEVGYDEVFVDPVSGEVKGNRMWGVCCERRNFVPFVHKLHNRLALPSAVGRPTWAVVGSLWILMSFIGIYLSLPTSKPVFRQWRQAWSYRLGLPYLRANLNWHRATGLWFAIVSILVALSGIGLAMYSDVFRPVVNAVSPISLTVWDTRGAESGRAIAEPATSFDDALMLAKGHSVSAGIETRPTEISYSDYRSLYRVGFGSRFEAGPGVSFVYIDAMSGEVAGHTVAGVGAFGDKLDAAIQPMHSGRILGMPGRILVFILGLSVALMATTGILMWLSKRRSRKGARRSVFAPDGVNK